MEDINHINAVIAEADYTSKWHVDQVGRNKATSLNEVSTHYTPLNMLVQIAEVI